MAEARDIADVAVVGGGLVGLATSLALGGNAARTPLDVRLVERDTSIAPEDDARASAITLASRRLFEALGIWDKLADEAQSIHEIVVTDSVLGAEARPTLLRFLESPDSSAPSACMVENRYLLARLDEAVSRSRSIVRVPATVDAFELDQPIAGLRLHDGKTIETRLVIGADGRQSEARAAAGIETVGWTYGQNAIVTTVEHELPHEGRAEEHFLPAGPFAILPLKGNRCSLVWTEETSEAERILALPEDEFGSELRRRFGDRLGRIAPVGGRQGFPLGLQLAKSFVAGRFALVGDAAHVVHPIAGLGFNLGLRDVAALAESVMDAARLGLDFGSLATLERYQAWRRADTLMVAMATDGLNRLFSTDNAGMRLLRDAGLAAVDRLGSLKGVFAQEAAGLTGRLPRLLQGEPV